MLGSVETNIPSQRGTLLSSKPNVIETLAIFVVTIFISLGTGLLVRGIVSREYAIIVSYASHLPQLLIPWAWYRLRVAPLLPPDRRKLWTWPAGTLRPFLKIASWMVGLKLIGTFIEAFTTPTPQWVSSGFLPVMLILLLQGVFVGISEEMMVRPALHEPLSLSIPRDIKLGRLRLFWAWLLTSILFGLIHLPNVLLGQSFAQTIVQALFAAIVGGIIGYYYERNRNYLGAAALHGLFDLVGYVPFLFVVN